MQGVSTVSPVMAERRESSSLFFVKSRPWTKGEKDSKDKGGNVCQSNGRLAYGIVGYFESGERSDEDVHFDVVAGR